MIKILNSKHTLSKAIWFVCFESVRRGRFGDPIPAGMRFEIV